LAAFAEGRARATLASVLGAYHSTHPSARSILHAAESIYPSAF
jgi:hypothetical protein